MLAINGTGNMAKVYAGMVNERVEKVGPLDAEIVPGETAAWYALKVEPSHEKIAVAHLIGRRFGIYLPTDQVTETRRGRRVTRTRLLLPGYVFVFVWGIGKHLHRLRAIPGVVGIMTRNEQPQVIPDWAIDRLREIENEKNPVAVTIEDVLEQTAKPRRKKGKKGKKSRSRNSRPPKREWSAAVARKEIIGSHAYSPYIEALRAESEEVRLEAFHKLLAEFPVAPLTESRR
jgi:transcription antitermination factor NusG